jgi:hypothetical protein
MAADTYSTTLGVLLMGTGNDSGTWGSNQNTAVFQILEDAIANILSETVTGGTLDLSGSPPPNAASQTRYAILNFSGTLTSNQIVKVPNLSKIWLVSNNTTGAFTLTIQTPTVTSSAAIPQGSNWQWVFCDGSQNVILMPMTFGSLGATLTGIQTFLYSNGTAPSATGPIKAGFPGGGTSVGIALKTLNDSNNTFAQFFGSGGASAGAISSASATSVTYNTSSDLRIKYDLADSSRGLYDLLRVKVRDFRFRDDPGKGIVNGLIAQELAAIYPEAVWQNGDDGAAPLGDKAPWGIDYGRLTPLLIKAIQQLTARVAELEARAV